MSDDQTEHKRDSRNKDDSDNESISNCFGEGIFIASNSKSRKPLNPSELPPRPLKWRCSTDSRSPSFDSEAEYLPDEPRNMRFEPSVNPQKDACAKEDAELLKISFGILDKNKINQVLTHRTYEQLSKIGEEYEKISGKSISTEINEKLTDPYRHLILSLIHQPFEMDAYMLYNAIKGENPDYIIFIVMLIPRTYEEREKIKEIYQKNYNQSLIDVISSHFSSWFKDGLISLLSQPNVNEMDDETANKYAELFYNCTTTNDETAEIMINIFCKSSGKTILKFLNSYRRLTKHHFYYTLSREDQFEKLITSIISHTQEPAEYFVKFLDEGIKKKNIYHIIAVVATRYQTHMQYLDNAYPWIISHVLLVDEIHKTFSEYEDCLSALLMMLEIVKTNSKYNIIPYNESE